jgi:hypothetical protein
MGKNYRVSSSIVNGEGEPTLEQNHISMSFDYCWRVCSYLTKIKYEVGIKKNLFEERYFFSNNLWHVKFKWSFMLSQEPDQEPAGFS